METIEVGRSELPGRTNGVMQTMQRDAGLQVLAFMAVVLALTGYRLTVNEGRRSRRDQLLVWNAYVLYLAGRGPWAPRAAKPYTSIHDEILHGNAVDFGGPGGAVIPATVHAVMVSLAARFGVIWTGVRFGEWWHFEVDRAAATEKITDVPAPPAAAVEAPITEQEDDDVNTVIITDPKGNIWVCDIGHHTKWNLIRGCKSVAEAMTRLRDYKSLGVKVIANKQPSRFVAGLDDITQQDYAKAA